jgi:hypothetical protein
MAQKKTGKEKKEFLQKLKTKGIPKSAIDLYDAVTEDDPDIVPGPTYNKDTLINEKIPDVNSVPYGGVFVSSLTGEDVPYDRAKRKLKDKYTKDGKFDKDEAYADVEEYKNRPEIKLKEKIKTLNALIKKGMPEKEALSRTTLTKTKDGYRKRNIRERLNEEMREKGTNIRFIRDNE